MTPPASRNPAFLAAVELCRQRGHKLVGRDPRYLRFNRKGTDIEDVFWMRENVRAFDRFFIRLSLTSREAATP